MLWDEKRLSHYLIICCGCVSEYQNIMRAAALCFWSANLRYSEFIWAHGHNRQNVSWVLWIYFTCRSRREVVGKDWNRKKRQFCVWVKRPEYENILCSVSSSHLTIRPSVVWASERWAGHWVSRKNSPLSAVQDLRTTNRPADYCPWNETVSADQTSLFAAVTFSSSLLFYFYSCLSVLCVPSTPAPSSRHHLSLLFLLPALAPVHLCPRPSHTSSFSLSSCCTLRALCPAPSGSIRTSTSSLTNEAGGGGGGPRAQLLGTRSVSHSPILSFPIESVQRCSTASPALISAFILEWYLLKWMCQVSRQTEIDLSTNKEGRTLFGLNWRQSPVSNANWVDH